MTRNGANNYRSNDRYYQHRYRRWSNIHTQLYTLGTYKITKIITYRIPVLLHNAQNIMSRLFKEFFSITGSVVPYEGAFLLRYSGTLYKYSLISL